MPKVWFSRTCAAGVLPGDYLTEPRDSVWDECSFVGDGVRHLVGALEENGVDYRLFEAPHSGHGVQNDDAVMKAYMETVIEYLDTYMPVE